MGINAYQRLKSVYKGREARRGRMEVTGGRLMYSSSFSLLCILMVIIKPN